MTEHRRAPFPRPPWDRVIAWFAAAGVFAFLVVVGVTVVPSALAERDAMVADGVRAHAIGGVEIVVPQGWVVTGGGDGLIVRTPDGGLSVRIDPADGDARTVLQETLIADLGTVPSATVGPFRSEALASGLDVVHADVGERDLYAVVGDAGDGAVLLTAKTADGRALQTYRAALGLLLDGVRA